MDDSTQKLILQLLDDGKSATEIVKILKDEHEIDVSKSTINRARKLTKALGDDKTLTPDERDLYLGYMEKQKAKEEEPKKWYSYFIPITRTAVDGPMDMNMPEVNMSGHQNFLDKYIPQNSMEAIDVDIGDKGKVNSTPTPFTAKTKTGQIKYPKFFWAPYTSLDLLVFQDVYTHTICGTIVDLLVAFSVGMGIKPVLKLINPNKVEIKDKDVPRKDPLGDGGEKTSKVKETKQEAIKREIDDNEKLLDPLIAIDESFGELSEQAGIGEDWDTIVEAFVRNHWVFGRDVITMETSEDYVFEFDGTKYPDIRTIAKVQHPRDLNFIEIDQETENLKSVSLMFSQHLLTKDDMIYLAHKSDSPIYNAKWYGYSIMQRMLGNGRSLRKLTDRDFPNIASIGYAPFTIIAVQRDEKGTNNENSQNQKFVNTMVSGQPSMIALNNPDKDIKVHSVDLKPDIPGMIEMAHYHAEAAAKTVQVPTALVSKEKDPNRDTLLGILRLFVENEIPRRRLPIKRAFTKQHYMVNWKVIYKGKPEILDKFRVEAEFTDIKIDSWADIVGAFNELQKSFRFKADAAGEFLGIENLESKIDPDKEPLSDQSFEDGNGSKMTLSKSPKPKKST